MGFFDRQQNILDKCVCMSKYFLLVYIYIDLAEFALHIYCLPFSNAFVERVFSRVSILKSKLRNRIGLDLLSSLLRVNTMVESSGNCCTNFEPTKEMPFNRSMYDSGKISEKSDNEVECLLDSFSKTV